MSKQRASNQESLDFSHGGIAKKHPREANEVTHKGYIAKQSCVNNHIWISKDGEFVSHIQCDKPKTKEELCAVIDNHIELMSYLFDEEAPDNA